MGMKNLLAVVVLIVYSFEGTSPYSPLIPGNSWFYKTPDGSFEDTIAEEKFTNKKIDYFQNQRRYSDGTAEISYFRIGENGAVYFLDNRTWQESMEIPASPRLSYRWTSADQQWKYQIIGVGTQLKTPARTYKDCVAIKCESNLEGGGYYIAYYSKGIGYVGTEEDGQLVVYLVRWALKEKRRS
jgi:hypothetical protein